MSNPARYHLFAMILHWLMALLIIGMIICGLVMEDVQPLSLRINLYQLHKSVGITVLFLALIRLGWRITHPAPALPDRMSKREKLAAHAGHGLLYALMVIMPLSGWLMASTSKYPTDFYFLFTMPALPLPEGVDTKLLHQQAEAVHAITTQFIATALIFGHILAALFHQFVRKDRLLQRITPCAR